MKSKIKIILLVCGAILFGMYSLYAENMVFKACLPPISFIVISVGVLLIDTKSKKTTIIKQVGGLLLMLNGVAILIGNIINL